MVREMVADPAEADDLSQQTLEAGLRQQPGTIQNLKGWFRGVAKNLLRQSYRSQARRQSREQRVASSGQATDPPMDELMERVEIQQKVAGAVLELPLEQRRILILRYYEQQTVAQIAKALGISESAAGLRIHRAKSMLRGRLQSKLGGDWRALALPIGAKIGKVSLATATTSIFAMNKFAKTAVVLFVGLLCSLPFFPDADNNGLGFPDQLEADLGNDQGNDNIPSGTAQIEAPVTSSHINRTLTFEGYKLKLVDANQLPIADAEVALHLSHYLFQFKNLHRYPSDLNAPKYPILNARTNEFGVAQIPHSNPEVTGYLFAQKEGFVLRGFPLAEFAKHEGSAVDLGVLELNSNAGYCWLQFRDDTGAFAVDLEVDCLLLTTADGLPSSTTPNGTIVFQSQRTDANGIVKFNSMPQGDAHLQIRSRRHVTWTDQTVLGPKPPSNPTQVEISRGESIHLRVIDAQGKPVSNAGVHYTTNDWHRPFREMTAETFLWRGDTNELGEFLLEGLVEGQGHRVVAIAGNAWVEHRRMEVGDEVTLQLPSMAEFKGEIKLEDGNPASAAKIAVVDFHRRRNDPDQIFESDEDGKFSVLLPHGIYFYEVMHADGSLLVNDPVTIDQNSKPLELTIQACPTFELRCIDKRTGLPIEGARSNFPPVPEHIAARDPENATTYFSRFRSTEMKISFEDGPYRSSQLAPGNYTIQVDAIGYSSNQFSFEIKKEGPNEFTVELEPITTLELLAVDASGTPQPGWSLMLVPKESEPSIFLFTGEHHKRYAKASTNRDGIAKFERSLLPGVWRVESGDNGYLGWVFGEIEIEQGANSLTFTIPRSVSAEFQVLANGQAVEGADIDLRWQYPKERPIPRNFPRGTKTNPSGIGHVDKLAPGEYRMDVRAPGLLPRREIIRLDQDSQRIQIEYTGVRVEGRVHPVREQAEVVLLQITDASKWGEDIPGQISGMFANSTGIPSFIQSGCCYVRAEVDQAGRFVFPQVPNGDYFVFAVVPEGVPPYPTPLTIAGNNRTDLVLQTPQCGRLLVELVGLNQAQLNSARARVTLEVKYDDLAPYYLPTFYEDTRRVIHGFRPGECELTFVFRDPNDRSRPQPTLRKRVSLSAEQTAEITIDLSDFEPGG